MTTKTIDDTVVTPVEQLSRRRCIPIAYGMCIAALSLAISLRGITDDESRYHIDAPSYLLNATFFLDYLAEWPTLDIRQSAEQYYARYPALTLGTHAPLPSAAQVPFYWLFGVSVGSARLSIVCFSLLAVTVWFIWIRTIYDDQIAFLSSLILLSTDLMAAYSQVVTSELPGIALIILASFLLHRYCHNGKLAYLSFGTVFLVMCVYARHTSALMIPIIFCYYVFTNGPRRLLEKRHLIAIAALIVAVLPMIVLTLHFSRHHVYWVANVSAVERVNPFFIQGLFTKQLSLPLAVIAVCSMGVAVVRRDGRSTFFLMWIVMFMGQMTLLSAHMPRLAIYWTPPFCLFAASVRGIVDRRSWRTVSTMILIALIAGQLAAVFRNEEKHVRGYEAAAKFVTEKSNGNSILWVHDYYPGGLIFFVRKHDPENRCVVLRADKLFMTLFHGHSQDSGGIEAERFYEVMRRCGIRYVVLTSEDSSVPQLAWIRNEVKAGDRFIDRKRIALQTNVSQWNGVALSIYEYKDAQVPVPGTQVKLGMPNMGGSISFDIGELLGQ